MNTRLFNIAEQFAANPTNIKKELIECKGLLVDKYRKFFRAYTYEDKKLKGSEGYTLVWRNEGRTNRGSVSLIREKS